LHFGYRQGHSEAGGSDREVIVFNNVPFLTSLLFKILKSIVRDADLTIEEFKGLMK
jgi:hypothetical protein